ncbi:MAG TPA: hypothetical protein PKA63_12055 [Oligoflexia bacterium]|nr:hypothetical protein [Oligoflexia bacterium]HMP49388.1 hypothetical protein [Oligoflexia bacterium]
MPDIWTFNPDKVKAALEVSGAACGVEPRVLTNRPKSSTCHINLKEPDEKGLIGYDIYVHHVKDLAYSSIFGAYLILALTGGIFIGILWGRRFSEGQKK